MASGQLDLQQLQDWQRRLLSDNEKIRLAAITEMMAWGFTAMSDADLEKYVKNDWAVLKEFVLNAKLNSRFVGWFTKGEIVECIRKNWPVVESLLLNPATLREAIRKKGKGKILYTPEGAKWFERETRHFYIFFRTLSYTVYCPACTHLVDPLKPIFAKWSNDGILLATYHFECIVSREEFRQIYKSTIRVTKNPSPMINTVTPPQN